jgi:hypothetical protein
LATHISRLNKGTPKSHHCQPEACLSIRQRSKNEENLCCCHRKKHKNQKSNRGGMKSANDQTKNGHGKQQRHSSDWQRRTRLPPKTPQPIQNHRGQGQMQTLHLFSCAALVTDRGALPKELSRQEREAMLYWIARKKIAEEATFAQEKKATCT